MPSFDEGVNPYIFCKRPYLRLGLNFRASRLQLSQPSFLLTSHSGASCGYALHKKMISLPLRSQLVTQTEPSVVLARWVRKWHLHGRPEGLLPNLQGWATAASSNSPTSVVHF